MTTTTRKLSISLDVRCRLGAVEAGDGLVITVNSADLTRLADPYRTIAVEQLASR